MINTRLIGMCALVAAASLVVADDAHLNPDRSAQQPALRPRPVLRPSIPKVNPAKPLLGDPLAGLTTEQLQLFADGRVDFEKSEDVEGGLGPIFNESSCVACHSSGAIGGSSTRNVTRFGLTKNGKFDSLDALGGSLLQDQAILPAAL